MSKIERGQFSSFLRRYLGMSGTSDVVDELAPEISATFPLELERPEWEWLKGQKLMAYAGASSVLAGNPSTFRFRNPAGSGVIAVFTQITASVPAVQTQIVLTWGADLGNLATTSGTAPRDTRNTVFGSAIIVSFGNVAPGGLQFDRAVLPIAGTWRFFDNSPFVLTPGNMLMVTTGSSNLELDVSASWLEKRLDALESQ